MADLRKRLSKRQSYLLRHNPGAVRIALSQDGWIDLDPSSRGPPDLLDALERLKTRLQPPPSVPIQPAIYPGL